MRIPASKIKTTIKGHSKRRQKLVFKTDYRLMQVKSIAECSKGGYKRLANMYFISQSHDLHDLLITQSIPMDPNIAL